MSPAPTSTDWQLRLGALGEVVEGLYDIDQCLRAIIVTPKGSVPHDPQFGCDLLRYLDRPLNNVHAQVVREVLDAIAYGEPRVRVIKVRVTNQEVVDRGASGGLMLALEWTLAGVDGVRTTVLNVGGAS